MDNCSTNSSPYSDTAQWILILQSIYLAATILASSIGNLTILVLVMKCKVLQYRSMIVSMSVVISDGLTVIFFHIPALISVSTGDWQFGEIGCHVFGIAGFYLISVRWLSMAVLSLDRFSITLFPLRYPKWSKPYLIILTTTAWVLPILMSLPSLSGVGDYSFRPGFSQCIIDCKNDTTCFGLYASLYTSQVLLGAILPSILYTIMYCISRNKRRMIPMGSLPDLMSSSPDSTWSNRDKRAFTTFVSILITLLVGNVPVYILSVARQSIASAYMEIPVWSHMLILDCFYLTTFLNPLLIIRNRDISGAIRQIFNRSRTISRRTASLSTLRRASIVQPIKINIQTDNADD